MEAVHLRGLLCGYGPAQIADILHKSTHGVESDLSAKVYSRVKGLLAGKKSKTGGLFRNIWKRRAIENRPISL
jgi:hypothetical protein